MAFLIDLLVLAPALIASAWVWISLFAVDLPALGLPVHEFVVQLYLRDDPLLLGGILFLTLVAWTYFLVGHLVFQRSVGMWLTGLMVVNAGQEGLAPSAAIVRVTGALVSAAFFGLGFVWTVFDGQKQGYHDKLAGTWVVRRRWGSLT